MSGEKRFRIRWIGAADIDRLAEIAAGLADAPQWPRGVYKALFDESLPRRIALVAEDVKGAGVVGFAVARVLPPESELESIAVSAGYQRQGVARLLMAALVEKLGRSPVRDLLLEVRECNETARAFYASVGFVEEGRRPDYYSDPVEDAILMRLRLEEASRAPRK